MPGLLKVAALWDDLTDPNADTAVTTHHYEVPIVPAGALDFAAFVSAWHAFFQAIDQNISSDVVNTELRFYAVPSGPGGPLGPPVHVDTTDRPGTSAETRLPPQVACSVTERTAIRARWGRFYIPGLTLDWMETDVPKGRFRNGHVSTVAAAAETMYESLRSTSREMAVYRRTDGSYQLVQSIAVDSTPDIVRRRRPKTTTFRDVRSVVS